jgi:hypothetical protein
MRFVDMLTRFAAQRSTSYQVTAGFDLLGLAMGVVLHHLEATEEAEHLHPLFGEVLHLDLDSA